MRGGRSEGPWAQVRRGRAAPEHQLNGRETLAAVEQGAIATI
jgi:hypothetical protein